MTGYATVSPWVSTVSSIGILRSIFITCVRMMVAPVPVTWISSALFTGFGCEYQAPSFSSFNPFLRQCSITNCCDSSVSDAQAWLVQKLGLVRIARPLEIEPGLAMELEISAIRTCRLKLFRVAVCAFPANADLLIQRCFSFGPTLRGPKAHFKEGFCGRR